MYRNRIRRSNASKTTPKSDTVPETPANKRHKPDEGENIPDDDDLLSSQASVMASQPPTQRRYLSQRAGLSRIHSSTIQKRIPATYFEVVLTNAGLNFEREDSLVLSCDDITFVKKLVEVLQKGNVEENKKSFIDGFENVLKNNSTATKFLGCFIIANDEKGVEVESQISMAANFLMIGCLQYGIMELLLKSIKNFAQKSNISNEELELLSLMLNHFRFVPPSHGDVVYRNIIEIFQLGNLKAKREIISTAETVLDPKTHNEFVRYLMDESQMAKADILNDKTVTTFACLHLSPQVQKILKREILQYIQHGCPVTLWPCFTKFMLDITPDGDEDITKLYHDLRFYLNFELHKNTEVKDIQLEVFKHIKQRLMISRKLYDTWLKLLQGSSLEFQPMDVIVLLIMVSVRREKCAALETNLRQRVREERLLIDVIKETRDVLSEVFATYTDVFIDILDSFLNENNSRTMDFAKKCYKLVFDVGESQQKSVLNKLMEIISNRTNSNFVTPLHLLHELNEMFPEKMQNWGMLLLPLLDRINDINLEQYRIIMKLLCSITYPMPPLPVCDSLRDNVEKIIKKQIINRVISVKNQGVIGITQLLDHALRTEEIVEENIYDSDCNATISSVAEIPSALSKQMAYYIGLVLSSARCSTETLALFYDELAAIFSQKKRGRCERFGFERKFFCWLIEVITHYFQKDFIVEDPPTDCDIQLEAQNCINTPDDASGSQLVPISVNIAGAVLKTHSEACYSILILTPLFNLVQTLHFIRHNGSLESINALLGCSIILPSFIGSIFDEDIFDEYDEVMVKKIIDIYFHTVNWYREVISAFASQTDKMIRRKVLMRLTDLIQLENQILCLLSKCPVSYKPPCVNILAPPPSQFKKPADLPRGPKPRRGDVTDVRSIPGTSAGTQNRTKSSQKKQKTSIFSADHGRDVYRQISPDIMRLLEEPLELLESVPPEFVGYRLGLLEFRFIVNDLISKLEVISSGKKHDNKNLEVFSFRRIHSLDFMENLLKQMPNIMKHYEKISQKLTSTVFTENGDDEKEILQICFGLCLKFFLAYFSWSGFDIVSNETLLKDSIICIVKTEHNSSESDMKTLIEIVFNTFISLKNSIGDLESAVCLLRLLVRLQNFIKDEQNFENEIHDLCKSFLSQKWCDSDGIIEKGHKCNALLSELLQELFKRLTFDELKQFATNIVDEVKAFKTKDGILSSFPNIRKPNFSYLYKEICKCLINLTNNYHSTNLDGWERSCEILNMLLQISKLADSPQIFVQFLQYSHLYIKQFLLHGLPVIEISMRRTPERINKLLKNLQLTTRFLHNLCCQSKIIKHSGILAKIPTLRETIENLTIRVQATLAANQCASAFWMGNLKNKDLQGEEILSQVSLWSSGRNSNDKKGDDHDSSAADDDSCHELGGDDELLDNDSSRSMAL